MPCLAKIKKYSWATHISAVFSFKKLEMVTDNKKKKTERGITTTSMAGTGVWEKDSNIEKKGSDYLNGRVMIILPPLSEAESNHSGDEEPARPLDE